MRPVLRLALPAAALSLLVLAGCGEDRAGPAGPAGSGRSAAAEPAPAVPTPTASPTAVAVPDGELTTRYPVTVLDDGDGAELCLGAVLESLPPQCGGPALVGWDWAAHAGSFEQRAGVRWGQFGVRGTFDGRSFTPSSVVPAADWVPPAGPVEEERDFTAPCPAPGGGWVPASSPDGPDAVFRAAERLPRYTEAWVDASSSPVVVTVRLAEDDARDLARAEATLREVWDGPLCVVGGALRTHRELMTVQGEVMTLPGVLGGGPSQDRVEVDVVADDGTLQAWLDRTYGAGTVRVSPALVPVG